MKSASLAACTLLAVACGWDELEAVSNAVATGTLQPATDASTGLVDSPSGAALGDGPSDAGESEADANPGASSTLLSSSACTTAATPVREWTFDSDTEGWILSMDQGVEGTLSWNSSSGDPTAGSLQVDVTPNVPTDGAVANGAWVEFQGSPVGDLTGRTISAWLWLDSGPSPQLKVFVQTGTQYTWADNGAFRVQPHSWTCVSIAVSSPSYTNGPDYDPADVVRLGFEMLGDSPFRMFVDTVQYY